MSLIIAGERSGVGKTTVTLALLAYLRRHQARVQSFKVGPDYIDPMFHRAVTDRPCRTLDPVLTSARYVQQCFATYAQTADYAVIEGVMGLFDGAGPEIQAGKRLAEPELAIAGAYGSTAHIARLLHQPVLLVVDCSRMSQSIAALVQGYRSWVPQIQLAGVVLNRVGSDRHLELLQAALEPLKVPILGVLRRHDDITIPDRHLGLVPTAELPQLQPLIEQLADLAADWFEWEPLLPLLQVKPPLSPCLAAPLPAPMASPLRVAIAVDAAFSFYYPDNLDRLSALGAELVEWSPLQDAALPPTVNGLYFGGGFPEMFAAQLGANTPMRQAVYAAVQAGMPTYAECGGLMYLCQHIVDFQGQAEAMVGVLPAIAHMGQRLTLGYRQVRALQGGILCKPGAIAWGHEFHRSHLTASTPQPLFEQQLPNPKTKTTEGFWAANLHASYVHLHWGDRPDLPQRFLSHCHAFANRNERSSEHK